MKIYDHTDLNGLKDIIEPASRRETPLTGLATDAICMTAEVADVIQCANERGNRLLGLPRRKSTGASSARDSLASLYMPRGECSRAVLELYGTNIFITAEEYLMLAAWILTTVTTTGVKSELAELRALRGDL